MPTLDVFDPPMCCSTGVCGPDADDTLAQFAATLDWAAKNGVAVSRYNLGHQPGAFVQTAAVKSLMQTDGMDCLPLVMIDGEVVRKGGYPNRTEIASRLGLGERSAAKPAAPATRCCSKATAA